MQAHVQPSPAEPSLTQGRLCIAAAAVLWSLSGVAVKTVRIDEIGFAFWRSLGAGLAMLAIIGASPERASGVYRWCPAVADFRTLYYPWRGCGTVRFVCDNERSPYSSKSRSSVRGP